MEPLGPGFSFALEAIKILAWPTATVISIYLFLTKGERLMSYLSEHRIEVRSKVVTVKIQPFIKDLPQIPDILTEVKPKRKPRDST